MSKTKSKSKHTDKTYLKRVVERARSIDEKTQDGLENIRRAIFIIRMLSFDKTQDRERNLAANAELIHQSAYDLCREDNSLTKPPELTERPRYDITRLLQWTDGKLGVVSKQIKWSVNDPSYIWLSEAHKIINYDSMNNEGIEVLTIDRLSKFMQPNGVIRYMRNGKRCKIHYGDFQVFAKVVKKIDGKLNKAELAEAHKEIDRLTEEVLNTR